MQTNFWNSTRFFIICCNTKLRNIPYVHDKENQKSVNLLHSTHIKDTSLHNHKINAFSKDIAE